MEKCIENSQWEEIKRASKKYGIDTNIEYVKTLKKSIWKKEIKEKVHNIVEEANSKRKEIIKMRPCSVSSVYKQNEYLSKLIVN